jgi:hypothetical protein
VREPRDINKSIVHDAVKEKLAGASAWMPHMQRACNRMVFRTSFRPMVDWIGGETSNVSRMIRW